MDKEERFTVVNLVYERQADSVVSFLTIPIELRKEWVDHRLVVGMAKTAKEFRNLRGWELGFYYYE